MNYKDWAICLRKTDYSETSQILTFYTRQGGRISAIAKGSRRSKSKTGGALEIFSYGQIMYSAREGADLATITEFEPVPLFNHLRLNLHCINCAMLGAELLYAAAGQGDPNTQLFDSFAEYLKRLRPELPKEKLIALAVLFQLRLLKETGLMPVFKQCVNCGRAFGNDWKNASFSARQSGLICPDCEQAFAARSNIPLKAVAVLARPGTIDKADAKTVTAAERILIEYFTEMMHRIPKMAKHVLYPLG